MRNEISDYFRKPTFASDDENIIANLLIISIYVLIIGTFLGLIISLVFSYFKLFLALSVGFIGVTGSFFLLKKHHLKLHITKYFAPSAYVVKM